MGNKKKRFLFIIIVVLMMIPLGVQAHHGWTFAGFQLHWPRLNNMLTFEARNYLTGDWPKYFGVAVKDWNSSKSLNVRAIPGGAVGDCLPNSNCMHMFNGNYGANGWLGLATVGGYFVDHEGDGVFDQIHLNVGATYMNDYYFDSQPFYNTPVWRQVVMCQEMGHIFGLGHNDENFDNPSTGTCMDYSNDPSPNQHPNAHDFDTLAEIYNHADSDTIRRATNVPASPPSQAAWGSVVHQQGNNAVYAAQNGDQITFTFVTFVGAE